MEIWKPVVGFEGFYEVSNKGRIKRIAGGGYNTFAGKVLKPYPNPITGYFEIALCINNNSSHHRVHTLIANAFLGIKPKGLIVDHINRNKRDNRIENLRYVTWSGNLHNSERADKWIHNRKMRLRVAQRKVNRLKHIKKDIALHKLNQAQIAKKYNVHYSTVSRWVNGSRRSNIFI